MRFTAMLTGPDLLARVKEPGDASKSELVREGGYVSTKKDGTERLIFTTQLVLQPGDEFEIKLGNKQIRLVPVGGGDEEE